MKVFNLTDVSTPALVVHRLVNHTFVVGTAMLSPGDSAEVPKEQVALVLTEIQKLVKIGAMAVDELPAAYTTAKAQQPKAAAAPTEPSSPQGKRKPQPQTLPPPPAPEPQG